MEMSGPRSGILFLAKFVKMFPDSVRRLLTEPIRDHISFAINRSLLRSLAALTKIPIPDNT
jgi:hypothetical protein